MKYLLKQNVKFGQLRLFYRWQRFAIKSLFCGNYDFVINSQKATLLLLKLLLLESFNKRRKCNICGWQGGSFYPNVGPGYFELSTVCPSCLCQDRHRSLLELLEKRSEFFSPDKRVIEVAPMRSFQQYSLERKNYQNYISFDYERFAMEQGDITQMRYETETCDYFLCFHVLEHIPDENKALCEINRVLKKKGILIIQVPIDWNLKNTIEYGNPEPRETNHVRRYGCDFETRLQSHGFEVSKHSVSQYLTSEDIEKYGLSKEPVFFAVK